jgi:hypothetical protein
VDSRVGLDEVARIKVTLPCRELNSGRPSHSLVTIPDEVSQLRTLW